MAENSVILRQAPKRRSRLGAAAEQKRRTLYSQGLNDYQVATLCGVTEGAIFYWRKVRGLPANGSLFLPPAEHQRRVDLYRLGLTDQQIGHAVGVSHSAIHDWRNRHGLGPKAERRSTERQGDGLGWFREISIEQRLAPGLTVGDTLRDWNSSAWLEEMGATVW